MSNRTVVREEIFDVVGVPPCPRCGAQVMRIKLRRHEAQVFWYTHVWLLPCDHRIDEAHFSRGTVDNKPHGWTWVLADEPKDGS